MKILYKLVILFLSAYSVSSMEATRDLEEEKDEKIKKIIQEFDCDKEDNYKNSLFKIHESRQYDDETYSYRFIYNAKGFFVYDSTLKGTPLIDEAVLKHDAYPFRSVQGCLSIIDDNILLKQQDYPFYQASIKRGEKTEKFFVNQSMTEQDIENHILADLSELNKSSLPAEINIITDESVDNPADLYKMYQKWILEGLDEVVQQDRERLANNIFFETGGDGFTRSESDFYVKRIVNNDEDIYSFSLSYISQNKEEGKTKFVPKPKDPEESVSKQPVKKVVKTMFGGLINRVEETEQQGSHNTYDELSSFGKKVLFTTLTIGTAIVVWIIWRTKYKQANTRSRKRGGSVIKANKILSYRSS